jgi:broad specificity phosphatase PhoE
MESCAQVCVVRHGETDWNTAGILQGWIDVPLNDEGRRQALELSAKFAQKGFVATWSSPLSRARETAEIIADKLGLPPPSCHDGLKERNFGAIQGVPKSELAELNPVLLQQILKRSPATVFENGEGMDEFAERVLRAMSDIGAMHAGERILVITHGWVMDVITRQISRQPRSAILVLKRKNGACLWLKVGRNSISADEPTESCTAG